MKLFSVLLIGFIALGCGTSPQNPTAPTPSDLLPPPAPAALENLRLSQDRIAGDGLVTGTVRLTAPAPAGGAAIGLSSNGNAASVPVNVTIAAGTTSATFDVRTFTPSTTREVTLTAIYAGVTKTAGLVVENLAPVPPQGPRSLTGRWTGRFTCVLSQGCGGITFADFQLDIVHGSTVTGSCWASNGSSGSFTLRSIDWGATPITIWGACAAGNVDVGYRSDLDTINGTWRVDFAGALRRQ